MALLPSLRSCTGVRGRCGQRRPGKRHIAYVTCQNIPGSPSLFGACVEGGPGNEAMVAMQ